MLPDLHVSFFRHDYRILKLRMICRGTRSVLICKSLFYFCAPHFLCSINCTKQIVILKTKIQPVSINPAANCNEHILWSNDAMPTLFAQCSWPNNPVICWQMISFYTLPNIFSHHYPHIFFWKCHERNLAWNWYGRLSSIQFWYLPYSIPKFPFHSIPCPASVISVYFICKYQNEVERNR